LNQIYFLKNKLIHKLLLLLNYGLYRLSVYISFLFIKYSCYYDYIFLKIENENLQKKESRYNGNYILEIFKTIHLDVARFFIKCLDEIVIDLMSYYLFFINN
jgi:hypothetical protein